MQIGKQRQQRISSEVDDLLHEKNHSQLLVAESRDENAHLLLNADAFQIIIFFHLDYVGAD